MIHLDAQTGYSFMRGYGTPKQWYERAKEIGATAFGIADFNSTWGHVPFQLQFTDIKLVLGARFAVVELLDKDPRYATVTLLPKKSVSTIYELMALAGEQIYYRPRITWKQIADADVHAIFNEGSLTSLAPGSKLLSRLPSVFSRAM